MRILRIMMRIVSLTLLFSTLICGLYLNAQGITVSDAGSLQFHMVIGIAGIVLSAVTIFLPGRKAKQKAS